MSNRLILTAPFCIFHFSFIFFFLWEILDHELPKFRNLSGLFRNLCNHLEMCLRAFTIAYSFLLCKLYRRTLSNPSSKKVQRLLPLYLTTLYMFTCIYIFFYFVSFFRRFIATNRAISATTAATIIAILTPRVLFFS